MKTLTDVHAELVAIGEKKSREGAGMLRSEYARLEQEEARLRAEYLRLLDGGES
jgi:hypothetical protein